MMVRNTNVKSTCYTVFFAQALVIWLTFFALSPAFAERPSKCEIIADTTKWLKPGEITKIEGLPSQYKLTGHALGYNQSLILAQLKYDPKKLGFQSDRLIARPLKSMDEQVDVLYELEDEFELLFTPNRDGYVWREGLRRIKDGAWMPAIIAAELQMGLSYHFGGAVQEGLVFEDKATGKLVGFVTISTVPKVNVHELSYGVFKEFRSKGYATEAIKATVKYLRARQDNYFIVAGVREDNPASIKVLEASGFVSAELPNRPSLKSFVYSEKK